ncbi:DUF7738 domain-containing protein [Flavobacterium oreochromis]|uniref:DUF7738 domain-containing protein n=1 Tax=Flavobacterium oreochromis TaxID=2906078 RepID=UPI00386A4378
MIHQKIVFDIGHITHDFRCMKKTILFMAFLMMSLLSSCQNTKQKSNNCPEQGFCIQDTLLYYNAKRINVGEPIANFVKIAGKPDRIVTDSLGGGTIIDYIWKEKMIRVNKHYSNNYCLLSKQKITSNGEIVDDTSQDLIEYNSIEEVIKKYGKYDEYKEEKQPLDIRTHYVWDKLGFDIYVSPEKEINGITLNTLHPTKLDKVTQKELEDPGLIYRKTPKKEYKGMFTYNGHTVDFGKMDYNNWFKTVEGLKIRGERFDPPGDSKGWSRMIYENNLTIEIIRDSNELNSMSTKGYSVQEIGVVNTVKSIQISN